ncbi:hypothetical protein HYQ46_005419 [Verticillium longisporum]|nr:hypothetical protein HYQ46_005419 [Verticillium longisporum]
MGLVGKLRERLASASKLNQPPSSNSKTTRPWITPGKTTTAETIVERPLIAKNKEHPVLEVDHENVEPSALPTDVTTHSGPDAPRDSRSLWKQAYDKLREEESDLVLNFQTLVAQEAQRQNQSQRLPGGLAQDQDLTYHDVQKLCQDGKQRMEDAEIRFKLRNKDHKKAKDMNDSGFIYVTGTLKYYLALEPEFQKSHASCSQELVDAAEESIIALYKAILSFQLRSALRFNRRKLKNKLRDAVDYDSWETMLQSVKDAEKLVAERWRPLQRTASEGYLRQLKEETAANLDVTNSIMLNISTAFQNHSESTREMAATLQRLESRALSLEEQEHLQVLRPHDTSEDLGFLRRRNIRIGCGKLMGF